jgi:small conductance mechanosensitive channel
LEGVIDKDLMVLTILNLTLVPSILIFDFGLNIGEPSYFKMRSKAIKAIKKAFDEQDITIPFPIRTLDFGIKGGLKLSQMELKINGATKEIH